MAKLRFVLCALLLATAVPAGAEKVPVYALTGGRVVTVSVTPLEMSVFWRTRPSPGKCLTTGATPDAFMPFENATTSAATGPGVLPNSRLQ